MIITVWGQRICVRAHICNALLHPSSPCQMSNILRGAFFIFFIILLPKNGKIFSIIGNTGILKLNFINQTIGFGNLESEG